jgi:hypothetical protein
MTLPLLRDMMKLHWNALALLVSASCFASRAAGELVVDSWDLLSLVSSTVPSDQDAVFIGNVQNPLLASHTAEIGASYASSTYDIGWVVDAAHIGVSVSHRLEQLDGRTATEGHIHLIPAVDSLITATGRWQYSWPNAVIGSSDVYIAAFNEESGDQPIADFASGGNLGLNPPFGTLEVSDTGLLHAGLLYEIFYFADIYHYEPTPPGTYGWGSGEIHFAITPVPEPMSLGLVLTGGALLWMRRGR